MASANTRGSSDTQISPKAKNAALTISVRTANKRLEQDTETGGNPDLAIRPANKRIKLEPKTSGYGDYSPTAANKPIKQEPDAAVGSGLCEICDAMNPTKYCSTCELFFCHNCINGHRKMANSVDHEVHDISETINNNPHIVLPKCRNHPVNEIVWICKDCEHLSCHTCREAHIGHNVVPIGLMENRSLLQSMCSKNKQHLAECAHGLKQYKSRVHQTTISYEEAIASVDMWQNKLNAKITDCAKQVRNELREYELKIKTQGDCAKVEGALKEIDDQIESTNISKTTDCEMFIQKASMLQELVTKADDISKTLPMIPMTDIPTAAELLPADSKLESLINEIGLHFCSSTAPTLKSYMSEFQIPLFDISSEDGCRLSKPVDSEAVVVYEPHTFKVAVLNLRTRQKKSMTNSMCAYRMIALKQNKRTVYVVIQGASILSLLNDKLKCLCTVTTSFNYDKFCDIVCVSSNRFVTCQTTYLPPYLGYITEMSILNNQLIQLTSEFTIKLEDDSPIMILMNDKKHVSIFSKWQLIKLNLEDGCNHKTDLSQYLSPGIISCAGVDEQDNIVVGTKDGIIHLFDKSLNHTVLLQDLPKPTDLALADGKILITTTDKLTVYSR